MSIGVFVLYLPPCFIWNNRHIPLYNFKVYSIMIWLWYIMKWLPQLQLTHINSYRYKKRNKNVLVIRTVGVYSVNHIAMLTIIITLYITSPLLIYLIKWKLVPFDHFYPVLLLPSASSNHKSDLFFCLFFLSWFDIYVRSYSICLCLTYFT